MIASCRYREKLLIIAVHSTVIVCSLTCYQKGKNGMQVVLKILIMVPLLYGIFAITFISKLGSEVVEGVVMLVNIITINSKLF